MRNFILKSIFVSLLISGCQATMQIAPDGPFQTQTAAAASQPTNTPPPSPTPETAFTVPSTESPGELADEPEPTGTSAPASITPSPTAAPPTAVIDSSQLNANCRTPMSLMLHSAFGAERMASLADEILDNNLRTITYRELFQTIAAGSCPDDNVILVSIDDLGSNWLRYDFIDMIQVFTERNLVLTAGVVTKGPQNEDNWAYFREIDSLGIEIASHSMNHYDLSIISDEALDEEVNGSYQIICEYLGKCPQTLIIPFGKLDAEGRVVQAASAYDMLISIQDGKEISGSPPYLLGRIPPDNNDQAVTINLLRATFTDSE